MMTDKIDNAIADLRARDGQTYRKARAAHHRASTAYDEAAVAIGKAGEAAYTALEHYMTPRPVAWVACQRVRMG
jgi:precorrin isomerase